ncbi:MAG: hypothetical protein WC770_03950 [Phycisphaerae bacterium]|jgi:hypothetical protein
MKEYKHKSSKAKPRETLNVSSSDSTPPIAPPDEIASDVQYPSVDRMEFIQFRFERVL